MSVLIGSAISAGASIIGGIIGGASARKAKRRAARKLKKMNAKMADLEANRQEIINPYEDMTSLSGMMSNPMANLSVATQATEAALQSKKNVAADIESQEKSNEDKRAAGEQKLQQAQIAEAERMQDADAMGKKFVYGETEDREMQQLNRLQNQIDQQQGIKAQASADQTSALTGAISGVAGAASSFYNNK